MNNITDILNFLAENHNLYPYSCYNNSFYLLHNKTSGSIINQLNFSNLLKYKIKEYNYNNSTSISKALYTLFGIILNDDLTIKNEFKPLVQVDNVYELFNDNTQCSPLNCSLVKLLFDKKIKPIEFLIKAKVFSSINFQRDRTEIIEIIHNNQDQLTEHDKIKLVTNIGNMKGVNLNKNITNMIINIFSSKQEYLDILSNINPVFKQKITNKKGFYFIDEYYNDSMPNIIDINLKAICTSSFPYLENQLKEIIKKSITIVSGMYPCDVFLSEKNMRVLSTTKVKKGANPKMVRNTNLMINYYNKNPEVSYIYCDFFRFFLENIFNEILEAQDNGKDKCKEILENIEIYKDKFLLEFQIPLSNNQSTNIQKF